MCVYLDEQDGQFKASTAADFSWSVAVSKCRIAIEAFINRSHLLHRGVIKGLALSQDIRYKLYPTYYSIRYSRTCTLRRACSFGSDTTRDVFDRNRRSLLCASLYARQYKFVWLSSRWCSLRRVLAHALTADDEQANTVTIYSIASTWTQFVLA